MLQEPKQSCLFTINFPTEQLQRQPSTWNVALNINHCSTPQYIMKVAPLITFSFVGATQALLTVANSFPSSGLCHSRDLYSAFFERELWSSYQAAQTYSPLQMSLIDDAQGSGTGRNFGCVLLQRHGSLPNSHPGFRSLHHQSGQTPSVFTKWLLQKCRWRCAGPPPPIMLFRMN